MPLDWPVRSWSRRAFVALAAAPAALAQHVETLPTEARRYQDEATEFPVYQLTRADHTSLLPAWPNRCVSARNFLVFSNDRFGKFEVFRMELRSGQWRRLSEASALDPSSVCLLHGDRAVCFIDGPSVRLVEMGARLRERELYALAPGYDRLAGLAASQSSVYVVESKSGSSRVRAIPIGPGAVADVIESESITGLLPRPGGGLVYRAGADVRYVDPQRRELALKMAPGLTGPMYWSPDGAALLYLNFPADRTRLNNIREHLLDTGADRLVSKTSQFVQFAPNRDATVFAGASGSLASPHILILLRTTTRELTLCEHRARDPRSLAIAFAPDSQRVVFQSDRHGKPAIFSIAVERFVEETGS